MKKLRACLPILLILMLFSAWAQEIKIKPENFMNIGRGEVNWEQNKVELKDIMLVSKEQLPESFEMSFVVSSPKEAEQIQAWAGFGYLNRTNRYAIGLRGGNNNDLYLCRYADDARNKMLALKSLPFKPQINQEYLIKIVFTKGHIRVYINQEDKPYIAVYDKDYITGGSAVLGGGWIPTFYKNLQIKKLNHSDEQKYIADSVISHQFLSAKEKESIRSENRKNYQATIISSYTETGDEISLNGDWLFLPSYEFEDGKNMYDVSQSDKNWHIMQVPKFWNPVRNWLHLEDAKLPHPGSGLSDNYREKEYNRCESYTFDYSKTQSAWYRKWLDITHKREDKRYILHFGAVSKIAELYVNGEFVGEHLGMFGDFEFDITDYLIAGKNLIALKVQAKGNDGLESSNKKVAQAVSVEVTEDMLNSIPHGMFRGDEGGIWQDVKLVINNHLFISDVFANVKMNGGNIEVNIQNQGQEAKQASLNIEISDPQTGDILFQSIKDTTILIEAQKEHLFICKTGFLTPKTWSPEHPHLYNLDVQLLEANHIKDHQHISIGFRSFEAKGNTFYLNGNPYWLRGANHPPCGIAPNDSALANTFYQLMHDGNQMITRSHACPFTKTWMDASDRQGIGVSYEGTWPWFLIGDIPSDELIEIWKNEMIALVKKYRNHPSLLMWTINNEMYFTMFYHNDTPEVRLKKWKIVSDLIKEIRKLCPGLPISADSGYGRVKEDFENNLEPHGIDDGDIDDRHVYFNWYNRDFYQIYNGEWAKRIYWSPGANPNRPFFSQETSTGYTNNDDGHFNRKYLFNNYVPQAWIGDWAYEDHDPAYTLQRHAFMSKELYETVRRTSPESAGLLLFSNVCWYKNVYDYSSIEPWPVYNSFKLAAQPVLISVELFGRNFFAGDTFCQMCLL